MRAVHTRFDRPQLIDDPWADRLVSDDERAALCQRILADADPDARARLQALGSQQALLAAALRRHPTYGGVILRSRYAENALATAVAQGVRQYVLVGAGFDSFCVDSRDTPMRSRSSRSISRRARRSSGVALLKRVWRFPTASALSPPI